MKENVRSDEPKLPPPPTGSEEMWLNVLNLTPQQLTETYGAFEGGANSSVVSLLLGAMQKISEAKAKEEVYRKLAMTDQLTGIGSRHSKDAWAAEYYRPYENNYMVIAFDLKHFKAINDTYGHSAGDAALTVFAAKLMKTFRFKPDHGQEDNKRQKYSSEDGLFFRPGGDEFVVVLTLADDSDVEKITEIMETKIEDRLAISYEDLAEFLPDEAKDGFRPLTSRYGFAFSDPGETLEELIHIADQEAKKQPTSR